MGFDFFDLKDQIIANKNVLINKLQTGLIYHYTFSMLFGTIGLVILKSFPCLRVSPLPLMHRS